MILLVIFILLNILYIVYRNIVIENYKYSLLFLRDELIIKTLEKGIDLQSEDYKKARFKLESFIENSDNNNITDFLCFKWIIFPKYREIITTEHKSMKRLFRIKDNNMKKIDEEIFQKAMFLSIKNMCLGSFLGWIYLICTIVKEYFSILKKGSKANFKKIKKIIFQKIKEVNQNKLMNKEENLSFI